MRSLGALQFPLNIGGHDANLSYCRFELGGGASKSRAPIGYLVILMYINSRRVAWSSFGFIVRHKTTLSQSGTLSEAVRGMELQERECHKSSVRAAIYLRLRVHRTPWVLKL